MSQVNFDIQLLRSFITIIETGSFVAAAYKLNMTQPAISQQMRRLEDLAGHGLFQREGRKLEITAAGERLARIANQMITLNDEIPKQLGVARKDIINIGMPEYYSETLLPMLIAKAREILPNVQFVVKVARSRVLNEALLEGRVHMALTLTLGDSEAKGDIASQTIPIQWLGSASFDLKPSGALPLVLFKPPCVFRQVATKQLDKAGRSWQCDLECEDLMTLRAALLANVGIAAVPFVREYPGLVAFDNNSILPRLPDITVRLRRNERWQASLGDDIAQLIMQLWAPRCQEKPVAQARMRGGRGVHE